MELLIYKSLFNAIYMFFIGTLIGISMRGRLYAITNKNNNAMLICLLVGFILSVPYFFDLYTYYFNYIIILFFMFYYFGTLPAKLTLSIILLSQYLTHNLNYRILPILVLFIIIIHFVKRFDWKNQHKLLLGLFLTITVINLEMLIDRVSWQELFVYNEIALMNYLILWLIAQFIERYNTHYNRIRKLALIDRDSNLFNRLHFQEEYANKHVDCSFAIIDIDLLRNCEELYGYTITNQMMKEFSRILVKQVGHVSELFRYNSDRFYVLFKTKDYTRCLRHLNRLKTEVESHRLWHQHHPIRLTISIGVKLNDEPTNLEQLVVDSSKALNESKILGRNKITVA
jgi:diguanylate cyclase (GGDEF)-like protein